MKNFLLSWGALIISVAFNAYGVFVIKLKLNELGPIKFNTAKETLGYFLSLLQSPMVIFGVILFFIAPFLFTISLSRMSISLAYPVQVGLNFLLLLLLAVLILKESLTFLKVIGTILILGGILFLSL